MKTNTARKPDFLDDVVDDMGPDKDDPDPGASMEEEDSEGEGDESMDEDQMMAAGQVAKALGMPDADKRKLRDALKAFVESCNY